MLFNSYSFIFLFLVPVTTLYLLIKKEFKITFLITASILFYALWSLEHLAILLTSVVVNYSFSLKLQEPIVKKSAKKNILITIIAINLLPLLYYKYSNFLNMSDHSLLLPLAISFFTFQQIAFQVDIYQQKEKSHSFKDYLFFILFFPQLIAGPIVHYRELIPQIKAETWGRYNPAYFHMGIMLFSIGLFKKVVLADNLAPIANSAFNHIDTLSNYDAWLGLFAYTFQIYFDFSGYSDMALGLALFFGIKLPFNFNSPYQARNLMEFWRSWHITLSNFLRDHIYIPLGGNRVKAPNQALNLLMTMTIGGIWHGAGWTFFLWGVAHGLLLIISHTFSGIKLPKLIAIGSTFMIISLLWVLFRANSLSDAMLYYNVLFTFNPLTLKMDIDELLILISLFTIWSLPNSLSISQYLKPKPIFLWYHSFFVATLFFIAFKTLATTPAQTFVYFNF